MTASVVVKNIFLAEILYVFNIRKIEAKATPVHTPLDCE